MVSLHHVLASDSKGLPRKMRRGSYVELGDYGACKHKCLRGASLEEASYAERFRPPPTSLLRALSGYVTDIRLPTGAPSVKRDTVNNSCIVWRSSVAIHGVLSCDNRPFAGGHTYVEKQAKYVSSQLLQPRVLHGEGAQFRVFLCLSQPNSAYVCM